MAKKKSGKWTEEEKSNFIKAAYLYNKNWNEVSK